MEPNQPDQAPVRMSQAAGAIEIRRHRESYMDDLFPVIMESRRELMPYMFWLTPEYSIDDARDYAARAQAGWDSRELFSFLVFDRETGRILGGSGLSQLDPINRRANLGYWVRSADAGRGVATDAAGLVARIAFEDLGLLRLEVVMAVENQASKRVAEKLGAHYEGVLRNRLLLPDGPHGAR